MVNGMTNKSQNIETTLSLRTILVYVILVTATLSANAAHVVKGFIYNVYNCPIFHAKIEAINSKSVAYSNTNGYFEITLTSKTDSLKIIAYNCEEATFFVKAKSYIVQTFTLKYRRSSGGEIIIGGYCISRRLITRNIATFLERTYFDYATIGSGTDLERPHFSYRGVDDSKWKVALNNAPLNDAETGEIHFNWLGNPGLTIGGSMSNIESANIFETNAKVTLGVSSYGRRTFLVSGQTQMLDDKVGLSINFANDKTDGYIDRSNRNIQSIDGHLTYTIKEGKELSLYVLKTQEKSALMWQGVSENLVDSIPTYNSCGRYFDDDGNEKFYSLESETFNHHRAIISFTKQNFDSYATSFTEKMTFNTTVFITHTKGNFEQYLDNAPIADYGYYSASKDIVRQNWRENLQYGYHFKVSQEIIDDKIDVDILHNLAITNGKHYGYLLWIQDDAKTDLRSPYYDNDALKIDGDITALANFYTTNEKFIITPSLQYRNVHYILDGTDKDLQQMDKTFSWNFLNPKIVINLWNSPRMFNTSFAINHQEPHRNGLKTTAKGQNGLIAETSYDFECGYGKSLGKREWKFYINFYSIQYKNQLIRTGELNDIGEYIYENVKDSYRRGLELSISQTKYEEIEWRGAITFSTNKIRNYQYINPETQEVTKYTLTDISFSPEVVASNEIMLHPTKGLSIGIISKYVGKQYVGNTSTPKEKLKAYSQHNFYAQYEWNVSETNKIDLQFSMYNILDKPYIYDGRRDGTDMYYFVRPGRHCAIKASYIF